MTEENDSVVARRQQGKQFRSPWQGSRKLSLEIGFHGASGIRRAQSRTMMKKMKRLACIRRGEGADHFPSTHHGRRALDLWSAMASPLKTIVNWSAAGSSGGAAHRPKPMSMAQPRYGALVITGRSPLSAL